jgi:hypothetical protein
MSQQVSLLIGHIENLDIDEWEKMSVPSLNFWIAKFIQEVADKKGQQYPGRQAGTLFFLQFQLRKVLDADMKEVHRLGITNQKEEKMPVTDKEEDGMWQAGLLGDKTAKSLKYRVFL